MPAATVCCDKASSSRVDDAGPPDATQGAVLDAGFTAEAPALPRFRREEGCARDFKPSGSVSRDMAELQRLCAQGMGPISDAVVAALQGGAGEATFRITSPGACLRAGAVAPSGSISLSLLGPTGELLASASSNEPLTVAPIDGTVCVREPGPYRAVVRAPVDVSSVTIQVWQAKKE